MWFNKPQGGGLHRRTQYGFSLAGAETDAKVTNKEEIEELTLAHQSFLHLMIRTLPLSAMS